MLRVYEMALGEPCVRSVRRPTEQYAHVVTCTLVARIIEEEATTCRDQDAGPQSLYVLTARLLYVVASHYM